MTDTCRVPDSYRPRPALLKGCVIALLSLWVITMAGSALSDAPSEQDVRTRQALNFGLPGLAGVLAIAWFARVREIRRKGESFLWIERQTWRRGEAIRGSVELGFADPVADAQIRLVLRRHKGRGYFGDAFPWSRVADHPHHRQLLSFGGTVAEDVFDSHSYMLEVRTQTVSGMRTLSGFNVTVRGDEGTSDDGIVQNLMR